MVKIIGKLHQRIGSRLLTQLVFGVPLIAVFLMQALLVTPQAAYAAPFTCDSSFYQVINGNLTKLDPQTGQYDPLGSTGSLNTNGVGYNMEDNYIYGWQVPSFGGTLGLVRIENDGTSTPLGIPAGLPSGEAYVSGDFDGSGNLYLYSGTTTLYKVDVSAVTMTPITLSASAAVNDLVYINGLLYGTNGTTLYVINPADGTVVNKSLGLTVGTYGAGWAANGSQLFFARNTDGLIFEISGFIGSSPNAEVVLSGDTASGNDGASCSVAASPIPPFVVANDTGATRKDTPITVTASQGVLVNDSGRQTTVTSYTQPSHGTVVINPDGSYTYTPASGYVGIDTFTYTVTDEYGVTMTATVTMTVGDSLANTGIAQWPLLSTAIMVVAVAMIRIRRTTRGQTVFSQIK